MPKRAFAHLKHEIPPYEKTRKKEKQQGYEPIRYTIIMGKELVGLHCVELGFDTFWLCFLVWRLGIFFLCLRWLILPWSNEICIDAHPRLVFERVFV